MAQTKRKRTRKHRGTPAGTIERAGRTGRPQTREDAKQIARQRRAGAARQAAHLAGRDATARRSPRRCSACWWSSLFKRDVAAGRRCSAAFMFLLYIPLGFVTDTAIYRFRQRRRQAARWPWTCACSPSGRSQENTYIFRRDGSDRALIVDPGDEADKLLGAIDALGVKLDGILLTHTHFDHVGAVAPVAKATGAEVWVPEIEAFVLADIMSYVPWPGFGPFESYDAEHTLEGGERLELAGFEIDVLFTPGHSPGHVTFSIPDEQAIFSGDVLFQGSRSAAPTCPGGDWRHAARVDPHAGRHAARGDRRLPRPHGHHHARRRAGHQPVPGRAGAGEREAPGPARHVRRAARRTARRRLRARWRSPDEVLGRAGLRAVRDARVRGHRAVRARGGGVHRHRPEGDVHLRGQGRPLADAAPRGHGRRSAAPTSSTACTSCRSR